MLMTLAACTGGGDRPVDVSLAKLAADEEVYDGKLVRTRGVVRTFESPRHYWIEDRYPNRVALEPEDVVAVLVGQEVQVVGRFGFDDRKGRVIEVTEIVRSEAIGASTSRLAHDKSGLHRRLSGLRAGGAAGPRAGLPVVNGTIPACCRGVRSARTTSGGEHLVKPQDPLDSSAAGPALHP
jgi:hypothetical protein